VSLDKDDTTYLPEFKFFEIMKQNGLPQHVDGIAGMSRKWKSADYETGPLLVEQLFLGGQIDKPMFAFYLTSDTESSYIDIGFMNEDSLLGGSMEASSFVWI